MDVEFLGEATRDLGRLRDVPFDAAAGEVVIASRISEIRALPESTQRFGLVEVTRSGERLVGGYTFNHTPWSAENRD